MKEKQLMDFMQSLWNRGLLTKSPNEIDYEWVIWDYLRKEQPPKQACDHPHQKWEGKPIRRICQKCGDDRTNYSW